MRSRIFLLLAFLLIPVAFLFAEELGIPAGVDATQYLIMSAIIVLTPVLVGLIKKKIYTVKSLPDGSVVYLPPTSWAPWIITLMPPLVSALLAWLATLISNQPTEVWLMFGLGVVAHYVRELAKPVLDAIGNKATKQQMLDANPNELK